tara:strand:+ start:723 stop:1622 length:900 start_codon:yes stop_codon:yes gene_type:complete
MSLPLSIPKLAYIQAFSAVAKHGSITAAARSDGRSLQTISRHIAALEADMGVALFDRRSDGLALTKIGANILKQAEEVVIAATRFAHAASDQNDAIAGMIRVTASRAFASFLLPDTFADFSKSQPEIKVDLVVTDETVNLLMREADIAVGMFRPTQQVNLISKKIGELELAAFAAIDYLARRGTPRSLTDLQGHDIIGQDAQGGPQEELRAMGVPIGPNFFRFNCDDQTVTWQMIVAGCGIGLGHLRLGMSDPRVQRVLPEIPIIKVPVWLTAQAELNANVRLKTVFDFLSNSLSGKLA